MRPLALSLLLCLPALAASGQNTDALQQTVEAYLGSIDTPIPDARWKALGTDAGPLLASIVDGGGLPSRRAGALHGLSIADPQRAAPLARTLAASASEPLVVRSAAVRAVARTLPPSEALAVLQPLLDTPSAPLQKRTAEALARLGPQGCRAVQAHAAKLSGDARAPFTQALAGCTDSAAR